MFVAFFIFSFLIVFPFSFHSAGHHKFQNNTITILQEAQQSQDFTSQEQEFIRQDTRISRRTTQQ